ncbi:UNVERIFIED_CONTAM: hypothetical protein BEN50_24705, partial [Euhalothece sp. KZN 001]
RFRLSVRVGGGGVDGDDAEVAAVVLRLLHPADEARGDHGLVAEVVRLFLPHVAEAAGGAVGDDAGLPAHEQGARGIDVRAGAVVVEADDVVVLVQDDVVDHAVVAAEDVVGLRSLGRGGGLLVVRPGVRARCGAQIVALPARHDDDEAFGALDLDRDEALAVGVGRAHHLGLGRGALDDFGGHLVVRDEGPLRGRIPAVEDVVGGRRPEAVAGEAREVEVLGEVLVDAAGAGEVHEEQLVDELREVFLQAVAGRHAQVVCLALPAHLAAGGDRVADLVDDDLVGIELEVFLLALQPRVAVGRLLAQLNGQLEVDAVARVRLQLALLLDDVVRALADEALVEVADLCDVGGQPAGPALLGLAVTPFYESL